MPSDEIKHIRRWGELRCSHRERIPSHIPSGALGGSIVNIKKETLVDQVISAIQLNGNKIPDLNALEPQLKHLGSLQTIYLEGNPCQEAEGVNYRRKIMLALPQLTQIDATCVPV